MSVLDNHQLKIINDVQITKSWYQIRMKSLQESTQVPVTRIRRSHPMQIYDGSQLILNAWKGPGCQTHCQIPEKGTHKDGTQL